MGYIVMVKTGDGCGSGKGTDANIFLTMKGEYGEHKDIRLNTYSDFTNAFEIGQLDICKIPELVDIGRVFKAKIHSDHAWCGEAWYPDYMAICRNFETEKATNPMVDIPLRFPIGTWIQEGVRSDFEYTATNEIWGPRLTSVKLDPKTEVMDFPGGEIPKGESVTKFVSYAKSIDFKYGDLGAKSKLNTTSFVETVNKSTYDTVKGMYGTLSPLPMPTLSYLDYFDFMFGRPEGFGEASIDKMISQKDTGCKYADNIKITNDTLAPQKYIVVFEVNYISFIATFGSVAVCIENQPINIKFIETRVKS